MTKPTSAVKRKWNKDHYDIITLTSLPLGTKETLKQEAKEKGYKNLTQYIMAAVNKMRGV